MDGEELVATDDDRAGPFEGDGLGFGHCQALSELEGVGYFEFVSFFVDPWRDTLRVKPEPLEQGFSIF